MQEQYWTIQNKQRSRPPILYHPNPKKKQKKSKGKIKESESVKYSKVDIICDSVLWNNCIECYIDESIRGEKWPARALPVPTSTPRKIGPSRLRGVRGTVVVISTADKRWRSVRESVLCVLGFAPDIILILSYAISQAFPLGFLLILLFFPRCFHSLSLTLSL